jgi:hypothetical protein
MGMMKQGSNSSQYLLRRLLAYKKPGRLLKNSTFKAIRAHVSTP